MELKKEYIGQKIYDSRLKREILICEKNKALLLQHSYLFDIKEPKNDSVRTAEKQSGKRRTKRNNKQS